MPKNVVCKKCNNLVNGWCKKVIDSPDPDMQRDCQYFREKTNADHIRSMSDEEMAETFIKGDCIGCPILYECDPYGDCKPQILNWLKQPFEGE